MLVQLMYDTHDIREYFLFILIAQKNILVISINRDHLGGCNWQVSWLFDSVVYPRRTWSLIEIKTGILQFFKIFYFQHEKHPMIAYLGSESLDQFKLDIIQRIPSRFSVTFFSELVHFLRIFLIILLYGATIHNYSNFLFFTALFLVIWRNAY